MIFGIDQAGGADDLLDDAASGPFEFLLGGRGADVNGLALERLKFVELERAVVQRAGQAEAVLDQDRFARAVARVHAADLRHGGVRFVDDQEKIAREKIEQRAGPRAGRAAARWRE